MRTVAILQARINSTRLHAKVLLPLAGKSMLRNIVERVQRATCLHEVVVAIPSDDWGPINALALPCPLYWHDDADDLVGRYVATAEAFNADLIVRIPCDNPCVDPSYIDGAVQSYLDGAPSVFTTNADRAFVHSDKLGMPFCFDGLGAEVFSRSRLHWLDRRATSAEDREHPHKLFYRHQESIVRARQTHGAVTRLDVNTQKDYEFISTIYDHFGHNQFTAKDILEFLLATGVLP